MRLAESSAKRVLIWPPASIGRSVRTGNDHEIPVRISHPALPVIRAAVTLRRIPMPRYHYLDLHLCGTLHDSVKVVNLEPK
jgi:hypothetical protein